MIRSKDVFWSFIKERSLLVVTVFLAGLLNTILQLLIPLSIGEYYHLLYHEHSTKGRLFTKIFDTFHSTSGFLVFFFGLILMKFVLTFVERYFGGMSGELFAKKLREDLFTAQLSQSLVTHSRKQAGKYLLRYSGDLTSIQNFITRGVVGFAGDVLFLIMISAYLFSINFQVSLIVFIVIASFVIVLYGLSNPLRNATINRRNQRSLLLGFVSSRMHAFNTIKAFNRETPERQQFEKKSSRLYQLGMRYHTIRGLIQSLLPTVSFGIIGMVLVSASGGGELFGVSLHKHDLFMYILLLLYLQAPLKRLLNVNIVWQTGMVSMNKLLAILNLPVEANREDIPEVQASDIEVRNVSYQIEGQKVIEPVSFECPFGTITWIQGEARSGKSTLLKLLLRLYEPSSGEIYLGSVPYSDIDAFRIRKNVTIVSDEFPLLGGTVFKSVSYSRNPEKRAKAAKTLEKVAFSQGSGMQADDILNRKIDDFGKNKSASERRMLLFARALMTGKKILLLDEPFAGLSPDEYGRIAKILNRYRSKRTIIIVSSGTCPHDLNADQKINLKSVR